MILHVELQRNGGKASSLWNLEDTGLHSLGIYKTGVALTTKKSGSSVTDVTESYSHSSVLSQSCGCTLAVQNVTRHSTGLPVLVTELEMSLGFKKKSRNKMLEVPFFHKCFSSPCSACSIS